MIIYGNIMRTEIFVPQFTQKLASEGEELHPSVIYITYYQLVVFVNNDSNRTIKLSIVGSLTAYVVQIYPCFVKYLDTMSTSI